MYRLIEMFVGHIPQNLAHWYYKNLCLDGSDKVVIFKRKTHEIKKKYSFAMSFKDLVAWAEEEARSPNFNSSPLK